MKRNPSSVCGDLFEDNENGDYKVTWKSDQEEALEEMKKGEFDVHLVNYNFKEKAGLEIIRKNILFKSSHSHSFNYRSG